MSFFFARDGALNIELKVIIIGQHSGWRVLPNSMIAAIGIHGLAGLRHQQKINNLMEVGDVIRTMLSKKTCRFKRFKQASSIDLYRAYQQGEYLTFGFSFAVKEGDYYQKALFSVTASQITEYNTNAKQVSGVAAPEGLELIEFEFVPDNVAVDYGKELDAMFLYRVKEQQKKVLKLVGAGK